MVVEGIYYTKDHEWVKFEKNIATVGIADYAQESLGEITFVELPDIGKNVQFHSELATVESSKAASDVYSPVAGKIVQINNALEGQPELINDDCYGQGWIAKLEIEVEPELDKLMDSARYEEYLKTVE